MLCRQTLILVYKISGLKLRWSPQIISGKRCCGSGRIRSFFWIRSRIRNKSFRIRIRDSPFCMHVWVQCTTTGSTNLVENRAQVCRFSIIKNCQENFRDFLRLTGVTLTPENRQRRWYRTHRLNMELDLQSLFGLHVTWCAQLYSLAETPQPHPIPPHWDSYARALSVSKDRHLFVTPCFHSSALLKLVKFFDRNIFYMWNKFFKIQCFTSW